MSGALQNRLPQELRLNGVTTMDEANRFLKETCLKRPARPPATPASHGRPRTRDRPSRPLPAICGTSCASRRIVTPETTIRCAARPASCRSRPTGAAVTTSGRRSRCMNIPTRHWPSSTARAAWPVMMNTAGRSARTKNRPREPLRRARSPVARPPVACGSLRPGHRADNRSGQLAWRLNRPIQFVIDSPHGPPTYRTRRRLWLLGV